MFTVNDLIDIAVKMERNGETLYLASRQKAQSPQLKSLLKWMAEGKPPMAPGLRTKGQVGFRRRPDRSGNHASGCDQRDDGDKTLSLDEVDFSQIRSTASLLETFVTFEQDTILFYEFLQAFIQDDAAQKGLKKIIEEEQKHVAELKEMIQAIDPQKTGGQTIKS